MKMKRRKVYKRNGIHHVVMNGKLFAPIGIARGSCRKGTRVLVSVPYVSDAGDDVVDIVTGKGVLVQWQLLGEAR